MQKLKIVSWNIWQGTYLDEVKSQLKELDADIIALQEVSDDERGDIGKNIAEHLGYEYVSVLTMNIPIKFLPGRTGDEEGFVKFGNAVLAKHKILNAEELIISKESGRTIIKVDVAVADKVAHVFGLHLKHTHQEPSTLQNLQADNLLKFVPEKDSIVMGDFNALPESYPITTMRKALQDTEPESSTPTWSVYKNGCGHCLIGDMKYKLDYIFTTKDIKTHSFEVVESKGSDHLPVVAIVEI